MVVQLFPFHFGRRRPPAPDWAAEERTGVPPEFEGLLRSLPITHPMRIDIGPFRDPKAESARWLDLITRSIEPNGFLEPAFAMSAAQHFLPGDKPMLMRIESLDEEARQLGLFAWEHRRGAFGSFARGWCPPLVALGTPLIDSLRSAEVLDTVRAWFNREHPDVLGLMFPAVPAKGPFVALLQETAAVHGLQLRHFDPHKRAVLRSGDMGLTFDTGGKLKEMRRQRRRLTDRGDLTYRSTSTRAEVRESVEYFLALEASGWKGRAGTALLCDPAVATFVRTMTRELAGAGNCRIDSLDLDGSPVAMGIVLSSRDQSWLWKIAYDENHASLSPGAQFVRDFTRKQLQEMSIRMTDSCAIPDHPMIDRLWPDRLEMTDIAISLSKDRAKAFERASDGEERRRQMRATIKRIYNTTMGKVR